MVGEDYYKLLGVSHNVSREDLKHAFHARIQEVHPDHNPGDPLAVQRTRQIIDAYRILSNSFYRRQYDELQFSPPKVVQTPPCRVRYMPQAFSSRLFAVLVFVLMGTIGAVISGAFTESQYASHGTQLRIHGIEAKSDKRPGLVSRPDYWCSKVGSEPEKAVYASPLVVKETRSTYSPGE